MTYWKGLVRLMSDVVRERPILFSGPMVRAILAGRKTQTRRIVSRLDGIGGVTEFAKSDTPGWDFTFRNKRERWNDLAIEQVIDRCPYGTFGSKLWVREAFSTWHHGCHWRECTREGRSKASCSNLFYRATHHFPDDDQKWVPSIFMPRWASRITLEIATVGIERLHEITEEDAAAESFHQQGCGGEGNVNTFARTWKVINGPDSWDANPWVWVVEFKRCEQ